MRDASQRTRSPTVGDAASAPRPLVAVVGFDRHAAWLVRRCDRVARRTCTAMVDMVRASLRALALMSVSRQPRLVRSAAPAQAAARGVWDGTWASPRKLPQHQFLFAVVHCIVLFSGSWSMLRDTPVVSRARVCDDDDDERRMLSSGPEVG